MRVGKGEGKGNLMHSCFANLSSENHLYAVIIMMSIAQGPSWRISSNQTAPSCQGNIINKLKTTYSNNYTHPG